MNTKIIAVVVGILILLGAGGFYLFSQQSPKSPTSQTPTAQEQSATSNSLFDLLTAGKTQSCTFSYSDKETGSSQGTFYLSGTKMRGDITTTTKDGKTSTFSMIRDGNTSYIWGPDMPMGIKMTISTEDLKTDTQANQYFNANQKVDYKCGAWVVDSSKFSVPTNVKFTDISGMMNQNPTGTQTQSNSNPCASITDPEAKAACENAMQQGY